MKYSKILILLPLLLLIGCETTGGIYKNLIPLPTFMKGKIESSIYQSADKTFEINTPFKEGSPAYTYMEVKEQYYQTGAYVSFLSSVAHDEIYRVEVGKSPNAHQKRMKYNEVVDAVIKGYKKQLSAYGSQPEEIRRLSSNVGNKTGTLILLKQNINGKSIFQFIRLLRADTGATGVAWVQWPGKCTSCEDLTNQDVLSENKRVKSYIDSFNLKI